MYCINYVIKKGDTLYNISRHYNVPISAIMDANPYINVYNLIVGETICIPVSVPSNIYTDYTTYKVQDQDTLESILDNYNINLADLLEYNDLMNVYIQPGTTLKVPIVKEGESGSAM